MEIGLNINVLSFLSDNSFYLLASPINGSVHSIYCIFKEWQLNYWKKKESYEHFLKQLALIQRLDKYCILKKDDDTISFINQKSLKIIINQLVNPSFDHIVEITNNKITHHNDKIFQLNTLISSDSKYEDELLSILNYENTGFKLIKEKISLTTPKKQFIDICEDQSHSIYLSSKKYQQYPSELIRCLKKKIHFIPIIKQNITDLSLGDCSYLDTCHKLNTCRYVHYLKYVPEDFLMKINEKCKEFNDNISFWEKISPFSKNGSVSNISRSILNSQWINCDVQTFDFKILGKFAAIIADPVWNIHMNLPNGSCNDTEFLNLPLSTIQDEGILMLWVTGRAIEIGKESLTKWGYSLKNELIWIKTNQLSRTICTGRTGHWLNHSKEHLLVGVKGNPKWLNKGIDVDVIVSPTRETSRKPDELYDMVERLVGPHARKLEIFGRDHNKRKGWFTIGNQLTGVNILEHDVLRRYNNSKGKKKDDLKPHPHIYSN